MQALPLDTHKLTFSQRPNKPVSRKISSKVLKNTPPSVLDLNFGQPRLKLLKFPENSLKWTQMSMNCI